MRISPMRPEFVAEVTDLDICRPLDEDEIDALRTAIRDYGVLVFPDQPVTDPQQSAFAGYFGEVEHRNGYFLRPGDRNSSTTLVDVSNLDPHGKPLREDDRVHLFNLSNCLWHSDGTFKAIPTRYSILSARAVNPHGGDTEFADTRAAYAALDRETRSRIDELISEHSVLHSRGILGFDDFTDADKALFEPVRQRLVLTDLETGRAALYLSSHISTILDMPVPEARLLILDLIEHATAPEFVYVHRWRLHDVVMWDDRKTVHRGRRYDPSYPRDLIRATVAGTAPTVRQ